MVEGARLESVYAGNRIESSNLFLSAIFLENEEFISNWVGFATLNVTPYSYRSCKAYGKKSIK